LALIGLLCAACDCEDCNGFYLEAWIVVEATTVAGTPVPNVRIRADAVRPMQTWMGTTDAGGRAVFHLFATSFPDTVQVSAEPPADFMTPEPVSRAVVAQDTATVVFILEPLAGVGGGA
jgi:hypothetical protein